MTIVRHCLIGLICGLLVSACGFRLAGTADLPDELVSINLVAKDFSQTQLKALRRTLTAAGANLVDQADTQSVRLNVSLKVTPDRQLATSASSGEIVKRIMRGLEFNVKSSDGNALAPTRTLRQKKDVTLDDNNLASSDREKGAVERELEQALYDQLVRQLSRL